MTNIHPVVEKVGREKKEKFLNQRAKVIWLTGLSGSGKSTIGLALEQELFKRGFFSQILDGDNIRAGINKNLKFTLEDRLENIRRISEVCKLYINSGVITISCFISPTFNDREQARKIIGKENFFEVFVNAPLEVCEQRDVKGLYAKARKGEIKNFTGIDAPFEAPRNPDVVLNTDKGNIDEMIEQLMVKILPLIEFK